MGTSAAKCCSAQEAQTADTKVEAAGEETHLQLPDESAPRVGAQSVTDVPKEAADQQENNAEPDSEPLSNSDAEEQSQADEKNTDLSQQTVETPVLEAQEVMPEVEQIEKNVVEPTETEKASAEEELVNEQGEVVLVRRTSVENEKNAKANSKDKKKAGDKEHSKPVKSKEAKGADDSKKAKAPTKKGPDDSKVLEGKDAFVGAEADAMKALDEPKAKEDEPKASRQTSPRPSQGTSKAKAKAKSDKVEGESEAETAAVPEAPKVDEAAKKKERKEAWKQMSDADKKEKGSALLASAKAGKVADVKKLLNENVSADYIDVDGWCGLHFAANEGKLEVTEVLLSYGADPTLMIKLGEWGQTPLHYAARKGHREIAEKLVAADKKGKAVRTKEWKGKLPHELASGSLAKLLKKLAKGS